MDGVSPVNEKLTWLEPIGSRSVVDLVMDRITDAIISGQFKPGDKIPTELELCSAFGVARNSVREAVKVLVSLGVLEIRRAEGTFVASSYSGKIFNPALYGAIVERSGMQDLVEVRRIFDEGVAQLAIQKGTAEDMALIGSRCEAFIRQLKNNPFDTDELVRQDVMFHRAIERASHNALALSLSEVITKLTIPSRRETSRKAIEAGDAEFFIRCHQSMADTIIGRDVKRVSEVIAEHYTRWSGGICDEL